MPAFEINGLHVVNGEILPVQYQLQDPNRNQAQADSAFIVRCNNANFFYYYKQIDKLWIRACLSLGEADTADLQFTHLIFNPKYTAVLGMAPAVVKALISPEQKTDIKNKLISAAAEYKVIDERKAAEEAKAAEELKTIDELETVQPPITDLIIPVLEEGYTGKLSNDDRATLKTVLLASDLGKPEKPDDYTGTADEWQNAWDKALAHTLHVDCYKKNMPSGTPTEIKDTLIAMLAFMKPAHINEYRFDRSANIDITPRPMIGDVFDDIQHYFYNMLSNPALCPSEQLRKLSPAFYRIKVGSLEAENAQVYTGLSDEQYALVRDLCADYKRFEAHLGWGGTQESFIILLGLEYSIQTMEYIIELFSDDPIKTEAQEAVLRDFLGIANAETRARDYTQFSGWYNDYKALVRTRLIGKLQFYQGWKNGLVNAENPVDYLKLISPELERILLLSLTPEEMRRLCAFPGFVRRDTVKYIVRVIPISEVTVSLPALINSASDLVEALSEWPPESAAVLMETIEADRLIGLITNSEDLKSVLVSTTVEIGSKLIKKMGEDALSKIMTNATLLRYVMGRCPIGVHIELLVTLGKVRLQQYLASPGALGIILYTMDTVQWPALIAMLGSDHIQKLFKNGEDLAAILSDLYYVYDSSVLHASLIIALRSALGREVLNNIIKTADDLSHVMRPLHHAECIRIMKALDAAHIVSLIKTAGQLNAVLASMGVNARPLLIDVLQLKTIPPMIENYQQLNSLLKNLPEASRLPLITALGDVRLRALIPTETISLNTPPYLYSTILLSMPLDSWPTLTTLLGSAHIKSVVKDSAALRDLYIHIKADPHVTDALEALKSAVGLDVIKDYINDVPSLVHVCEALGQETRVALINMLGVEQIIGLVKSGDDLDILLNDMGEKSGTLLVEMLGLERILALVQNDDQLRMIMGYLPEASKLALISEMDADRLRVLISSGAVLGKLLKASSASLCTAVITKVGTAHIKSIIINGAGLRDVISKQDHASRIALIGSLQSALGSDGMTEIISSAEDLNEFLTCRTAAEQKDLIESLGVDHLVHIIKDADGLNKVLEKREAFTRTSLIDLLGMDRIQGIILDKDDLAAVLSALPNDADKLSFITMLKNNISDSTALRIVLRHLSEDSSKQALIEMLKPEILSGLIKNRAQLEFVQGGLGIGPKNTLEKILASLTPDSLRAIMGHDGIGYADPEILAKSLCGCDPIEFRGIKIDDVSIKIGGVVKNDLMDNTTVYWPPEGLLLAALDKLDKDRLRAIVSSTSELGHLFANTSAFAWPTLITMLGSKHILLLIQDAEALTQVLSPIRKDLKKLELLAVLKFSLGNKGMKAILSKNNGLRILCDRFLGSRVSLMNTLGPDILADTISDASQLASAMFCLDRASAAYLMTILSPVRIEAMIKNGTVLASLIEKWEEPSRIEFLAMLGPNIVDIIDRGAAPSWASSVRLEFNRAYKYHSHYHMKRPFDADAINTNIASIFADVASSHRYGLPFLVNRSADIAAEIINRCKLHRSAQDMLSFLQQKQSEMDLTHSVVATDGELAMRIMYCIEQLNYHLNPEKPALSQREKKAWKQVLPGTATAGLACGVGIGLALAFTPGLHLVIGAIIGITVAAALIAMAVYAIAVHELGAKKDFTDKGLFTSWSVFNKADAPVGANNRPAGPIRPVLL